MPLRSTLLLFTLILGTAGTAVAQYSRTPAGENIDTRILGHTPDDLMGRPILGAGGPPMGTLDGIVMGGPGTFAVVTLAGTTRRVLARLGEFKVNTEGRITTSLTPDDLASEEDYTGQAGYQPITGDNLTIGDALSSYD